MIRQEKEKFFRLEGGIQDIEYGGTIEVLPGMSCETYTFKGDHTKDLGIIHVDAGIKTPRQRVLLGERTVEYFMSGEGRLVVETEGEDDVVYEFRLGQEPQGIEVEIGQIMQWHSTGDDLVFAELCKPPYQDGRFENLPE